MSYHRTRPRVLIPLEICEENSNICDGRKITKYRKLSNLLARIFLLQLFFPSNTFKADVCFDKPKVKQKPRRKNWFVCFKMFAM